VILSILHISDLHRDPDNPIRNDVLLDSLENDRRHYSSEERIPIKPPNLVVVSGDIIHGVAIGTTDADNKIAAQYEEALSFLRELADRFVGGDLSRVIIGPGNHDVGANVFRDSLKRIEILPDRKKDLVTQLFSPGSRLRWSWSDFALYEITDEALYRERLAAFADFYSAFYDGKHDFDLDPSKQLNFFDFAEFDLSVASFSSCYNNDLFNRQAAIHPACIADAANKLRQPMRQSRLRIGVWHHNTEGIPAHSDYMDPDIIQNMIDRGFSIGLHGHQHRPQFLETKFRHGINRKIVVISAGTLCGGPSFRHGRAYNIIEIDTESRTGRLHVREMQNDNLRLPIWGPRPLPHIRQHSMTSRLTRLQSRRFIQMKTPSR
jgi:predicted MPP superfamily phosphohydrolase